MISSLVKIFQYWLEIQAVRARWNLERDIEKYVQSVETEINEARKNGDHARADNLRHKLLRSSGVHLPSRPSAAPAPGTDTPGRTN